MNDPRFLNTTEQERITEYWAYRYADDPKLADEVEDESFNEDDILAAWSSEGDFGATETVSSTQLADPQDWEEL